MNISVIIMTLNSEMVINRCIGTVKDWVGEIIILDLGSIDKTLDLIGKTGYKIISGKHMDSRIMLKSALKKAKGSWIFVLNADEEVSIPLKREIMQTLPKTEYSSFYIPLIYHCEGVWRKKSSGELRLFKKSKIGYEKYCCYLKNPIRHYRTFKREKNRNLKDLKKETRKILVIKLRGIGDTVILTPLLKNLKAYFKSAEISVLVKHEAAGVLKHNPNIKEVIPFEGVLKTSFDLREKWFDMVICPQAGLKPALIALSTGAKIRIVNNHNGRNYFSTFVVPKPEEYETAIDRDLDCLRVLGIPVKDKNVKVFTAGKEKRTVKGLFRKIGIRNTDKVVGISISASKSNKMWAKEKFTDLAGRIIKELKYKVIFFEDPSRKIPVTEAIRLKKNKPLIVNEPDLRKVISAISQVNLFIGNDSGLSHIAAAQNIPTVTIVGPDEPKIFHPYKKSGRYYVVSKDLDCKPCWKKDCDKPDCLGLISVDDVFKAVKQVKI